MKKIEKKTEKIEKKTEKMMEKRSIFVYNPLISKNYFWNAIEGENLKVFLEILFGGLWIFGRVLC